MLKALKTGFIAAVAALALAPFGVDAQQAQQKSFSIATGGTGGVYYPMGGGMANLLSKYVPGWQATAEVTAGSVANLQFLGTKKAEIAFVMVDAALDALKGEEKFKGNPVDVRTLMVLYPNRMHVVSTEAMGVKTMKDLKGKRVSTGSPGSATEVMAFRVIEAAGAWSIEHQGDRYLVRVESPTLGKRMSALTSEDLELLRLAITIPPT